MRAPGAWPILPRRGAPCVRPPGVVADPGAGKPVRQAQGPEPVEGLRPYMGGTPMPRLPAVAGGTGVPPVDLGFVAAAVTRRWFGLVFALAVSAAFTRADTTLNVPTATGSGATVRLTSPCISVPRFGFLPLRVWIENATGNDGVWHLRFESGQRQIFPGTLEGTRDFAVPAGQNREFWVYLPTAEPGVNALTSPSTRLIS